MLQTIRLFMRVSQHALRLGRKRQLDTRGNLFAQGRAPFDLFADRFKRGLRARQKTCSQRLVFAHQAQEQMLRLDSGRAELRSFVAGEEDNAPCFLRVAFEHKKLMMLTGLMWRTARWPK